MSGMGFLPLRFICSGKKYDDTRSTGCMAGELPQKKKTVIVLIV